MTADDPPGVSVSEPTLYVAFELGKKDWKLAMTSGFGIDAVAADGGRVAIGGGAARAARRGGGASGCPRRRGW